MDIKYIFFFKEISLVLYIVSSCEVRLSQILKVSNSLLFGLTSFYVTLPFVYSIFLRIPSLISKCNYNIQKISVSRDQVPPRFELGSLDSKSRVLTITPWDPLHIA